MDKLDILINKFENDDNWNTLNQDGTKRFDKYLIWIKGMIEQYAEKLDMNIDDVVDVFEGNRNYSWPNYYQAANFPDLEEMENISIYETMEEFKAENREFKCPSCGNIYGHPTHCEHRIKKDGVCDWVAGGFFKIGLQNVIIKDVSILPMAIFETAKD